MTRMLTIPTIITLTRLAAAPWIGLAIVQHAWSWAFVFFVLAALSDILDGELARRLNEQTALGACLDPVADKILIFTCFLALAHVNSPFATVPWWFVYGLLLKEIILIAGAVGTGIIRGGLDIRPLALGKIAMMVQSCFVAWLIWVSLVRWNACEITSFLLGLTTLLVIASFIHYSMGVVREWLLWFARDV